MKLVSLVQGVNVAVDNIIAIVDADRVAEAQLTTGLHNGTIINTTKGSPGRTVIFTNAGVAFLTATGSDTLRKRLVDGEKDGNKIEA